MAKVEQCQDVGHHWAVVSEEPSAWEGFLQRELVCKGCNSLRREFIAANGSTTRSYHYSVAYQQRERRSKRDIRAEVYRRVMERKRQRTLAVTGRG